MCVALDTRLLDPVANAEELGEALDGVGSHRRRPGRHEHDDARQRERTPRAQRSHRPGAEQDRSDREPQPEHRGHRAREHHAERARRERDVRPAPARGPSFAERDADRAHDEGRPGERREVVDPHERGLALTRALPLELGHDPEELEEPPGRRGDAPGDHCAEQRGEVAGRADEEHRRGEERRVPRELGEADRVSRRGRTPRRGARASRARPRRRGGTPPPSPSTTRARTSGCLPSRRARSPAATRTQAIAASARVASIEVEPTPTETLG